MLVADGGILPDGRGQRRETRVTNAKSTSRGHDTAGVAQAFELRNLFSPQSRDPSRDPSALGTAATLPSLPASSTPKRPEPSAGAPIYPRWHGWRSCPAALPRHDSSQIWGPKGPFQAVRLRRPTLPAGSVATLSAGGPLEAGSFRLDAAAVADAAVCDDRAVRARAAVSSDELAWKMCWRRRGLRQATRRHRCRWIAWNSQLRRYSCWTARGRAATEAAASAAAVEPAPADGTAADVAASEGS